MGEIGKRLYDELVYSNIDIKYVIDENAIGKYLKVEVLDKDDEYAMVDVVVVTAMKVAIC